MIVIYSSYKDIRGVGMSNSSAVLDIQEISLDQSSQNIQNIQAAPNHNPVEQEVKTNFKFGVPNKLKSVLYAIGAFTFLNEGWNGWVYSLLTISNVFQCWPYNIIAISGGLILGLLYANIFTAFNWKEYISGGLSERKQERDRKAKQVLDLYAQIENELVPNPDVIYITAFRLSQVKDWLRELELSKQEYEDLKSKETLGNKTIRYLCGGFTGVMYCLAAYFTTSQAFILLGISVASPFFMPLFIGCALAEGLGFFIMENSSLMKQMKLGAWADIDEKQKELTAKLELEKYKLECEVLDQKINKKFTTDLDSKLVAYKDSISQNHDRKNLENILEEINRLKLACDDLLEGQEQGSEQENLSCWQKFRYKFRKLFRPALYLLLGSGIVLYFSDGVDGIMTCFDFAKTSFHMHATITFTVTAVAVAVLLGLMQAVFYWAFDGGFIRREFGLSCKQLRKEADQLLTSLKDLKVLLDKSKEPDAELASELDREVGSELNAELASELDREVGSELNAELENPLNLEKLEELFIKLAFEKEQFESNLVKIDGFLEKRKDFKSVKAIKYTGYALGVCINAAAGFFCGKMLLGSLVMLGVASPPGLAVLLSVGSICALGRVLSFFYLERKKFGELFFGSKKRQETFKQKKTDIDKAYYITKLALFNAKDLKGSESEQQYASGF